MMIFETLINGIAAACLSTSAAPDYVTSASQWCHQQQEQYIAAHTAAPAKSNMDSNTTKAAFQSLPPSRWYTSWTSAWKAAHEQGYPLVCVIVHEGCPECEKMNAVLSKPAAASTLKKAVKLKLEFNSNPGLVQRWGIKYTPTFLVFSPAHNFEVYREVGALSLERLRTLQPSIEGLITQPQNSNNPKKSSAAAPDSNVKGEEGAARAVAGI